MKKRFLTVCLILLCSLVCSAQSGSIDGAWRGIWTNPAGFVFTAEVTLQSGPGCKLCAATGPGSIQGKIVWTLRKVSSSASPDYVAKIGMTGTELVKGEMKGDGLLVLNGYEKDDPNSIIGLDQYRLAISDNEKVIGGITFNNGSWTGQLIAVRAQL